MADRRDHNEPLPERLLVKHCSRYPLNHTNGMPVELGHGNLQSLQ